MIFLCNLIRINSTYSISVRKLFFRPYKNISRQFLSSLVNFDCKHFFVNFMDQEKENTTNSFILADSNRVFKEKII